MFSLLMAAMLAANPVHQGSTDTTPEEWLSEAVDVAMYYPYQFRDTALKGVATVTFEIDQDRTPKNLQVTETSGITVLDSTAVRIVRSLPTFPTNFPVGRHAVVLKWDMVEENDRNSLKGKTDKAVASARSILQADRRLAGGSSVTRAKSRP